MTKNTRLALLLLLALPFLTGCIHKNSEGETITLTYEWWVWLSLFLGGIAGIPVGFLLRAVSDRLGWILMIVGAIVLFGFAPSMFLEKLVLTNSKLTQTTGFWGMTKHEVTIENLAAVRFTREETRGRRGRKNTNYYVVCAEKDGKESKLSATNDMFEEVAEKFLMLVKAKDIPIVDAAGLGEPTL